jgi:NADPH:quinone reductase-like Zn-dependent oxidoreductase
VLVLGASGGVGTYAVQIAKMLGATVTGVCSTRNVELVRSLGADRVVDYTREDFTRDGERHDVIIDNVGSHSLLDYRRALTPDGIVVLVGSNDRGVWLGPLIRPLQAMVLDPFVSQRFRPFLAELTPEDLGELAALMATGEVRSVIDRRFPLAAAAEAVAYVEGGRTRGKVVLNVVDSVDAVIAGAPEIGFIGGSR